MSSAANEAARNKMTTGDLMGRLRRHYIKPGEALAGGVFVEECGLNGMTGSRVDAVYVGFTSASGRLLVGHEVKVSRSDWLVELSKVGKADRWADNCHQWMLVAPGPEVVPREELPDGWGLMYPGPSKTRMKIVVKPKTRDVVPSWLIVRSLMARLDTLQAQAMTAYRRRVEDEAHAAAEKRLQDRGPGQPLTPEQQTRLSALDRLEEYLGARIDQWAINDDTAASAAEAAATLRLVQKGSDLTSKLGDQRYQRESLKRAAESLLASIDEWGTVLDGFRALVGDRRG